MRVGCNWIYMLGSPWLQQKGLEAGEWGGWTEDPVVLVPEPES